jgi:hypothetical protein
MGKAKVNKRNYTSDGVRAAAARAYLEVGPKAPAALKARFAELAPDHTISDKHVTEFCKKWSERFSTTSSISFAPKPGRPKQLSDQQLRTVVGRITKGKAVGGSRRPYSSYADAVKHDKVVRDIVLKASITVKTLRRRVATDAPGSVVRGTVYIRAVLGDAHKVARLEAAQRNLKRSMEYWKRVFWLDSAKMYLNLHTTYKGLLTGRATVNVISDSRAPYTSNTKGKKLKFYAVVNALVGPVAFIPVTGTTGHKKKYKVSCGSFYTCVDV